MRAGRDSAQFPRFGPSLANERAHKVFLPEVREAILLSSLITSFGSNVSAVDVFWYASLRVFRFIAPTIPHSSGFSSGMLRHPIGIIWYRHRYANLVSAEKE